MNQDRREDHPRTATVLDIDGVERVMGYAPLQADSGGLLVTFGLDKAQAFGEIQRRTQFGVLLIALSTSLVLVLTGVGARRFIHRPLGQLVDAANQWRLGDLYAPCAHQGQIFRNGPRGRRVQLHGRCARGTGT